MALKRTTPLNYLPNITHKTPFITCWQTARTFTAFGINSIASCSYCLKQCVCVEFYFSKCGKGRCTNLSHPVNVSTYQQLEKEWTSEPKAWWLDWNHALSGVTHSTQPTNQMDTGHGFYFCSAKKRTESSKKWQTDGKVLLGFSVYTPRQMNWLHCKTL